MKRIVKITTIQPPAPAADLSAEQIIRAGLELFDAAAAQRPDIVCLPEYFNCMADPIENNPARFGSGAAAVLEAVSERARRNGCHVILPLIVEEGGRRSNRACLIDRGGRRVGQFDKVHLTSFEKNDLALTAGGDWPVFTLDFGRIGVMICYDGCFWESARILALRGAEVIFWPSLQRSYTRKQLELQTRAHAYFNYVTVVRSSYGRRAVDGGNPAGMVGLSCVCNAEGEMLDALDGQAGWIHAAVDLNDVPRGPRTFGGPVGPLRAARFADRRPETYRLLTAPRGPED